LKDVKNTATILELEYQLALVKEDWEAALHHLQDLQAHNDSLSAAQMNLKLAGLQVLHELKTKEQANAQLRDINEKQAITISDQRSSNRYLSILLAVGLLLVVALFIISRYTMKMMRRLARKNEVIRRQNEDIQSKVLELKRQNLRLAESLMSEEEKEMILKEIHHRVKNNLQVVDSLLNIQSNEVQDPISIRILREAQGRIRSMAMVHEHIYRSTGDLNSSLRIHIEKLGRSVLVAHGVHDRISIRVDTDLPAFPVETLLPLSLMLNELLTNSIKHAFNGMQAGNIRIVIKSIGDRYELRYSDDGKGFESTQGIGNSNTFGRELITILAHQLNGEVKLLPGAGVAFGMVFMPDRELARKAG
jgi:two-component sensor histidine kinase